MALRTLVRCFLLLPLNGSLPALPRSLVAVHLPSRARLLKFHSKSHCTANPFFFAKRGSFGRHERAENRDLQGTRLAVFAWQQRLLSVEGPY